MTTEETEIIQFMSQFPDSAFSRKEISKKAKRREEYEENPNWATGPLKSLVDQGLIVEDAGGYYKLFVDDKFRW
ncbi:MAG: hypothetical protein JWQ71_853 [Pedosphaera sp.]|nr:hypothetical protein [Pedosphaera sp.]